MPRRRAGAGEQEQGAAAQQYENVWKPGQSPPRAKKDSMMQANGHYFDRDPHSAPAYSDYDGSHYGSQYEGSHDSMESGRASGVGWQAHESVNGGSEFDAFDFHQTPINEPPDFDFHPTPRAERASLALHTHVRMPMTNPDLVGRHLLYETALLDTQSYDILDIAEVDALKKEQERLHARIEATQRKLALESKVRNAAQNLQRLYSTKRPDTPQSPESPRKQRNSLLSYGRVRGGSNTSPETARQADIELAASVKKVDELHDQITQLLDRRQDVERRLLRHTAAVLAEEANRNAQSAVAGLANGHHYEDDDFGGGHAFSDFDGIRDILHGRPVGASNATQQADSQQLSRVQDKLEQLNYQLRNLISDAGQTLAKTPPAEVGLDQSDDSTVRVENRFVRLERNLQTLEQQHREIKAVEKQNRDALKAAEEQVEAGRRMRGNMEAIEEHLEGVNGQLHSALIQASDNQPVPGLQEPPRAGEQGYQEQLQYMEEGLLTMEQLLQQRSQSGNSLESQERVEELSKKNAEYDAVVSGLWQLLQSDTTASRDSGKDGESNPNSPTPEPFSLQAFNSQVQRIFERAQSAREQHDILRRQIQQQRDLGGKSDMEKEQQIAELQNRHDKLAEEHGAVQREMSDLMLKHQQAQGEANESQSELEKVMQEVEEMRRIVETKQQERDEMANRTGTLQQHIQHLEAQTREMTEHQGDAETKHTEMHQTMEDLESEVVRLTTELTMAKAELDSAYGTRAERAGAQAAEVESLHEKNKEITTEMESLRSEVEALRSAAKSADHATQLEKELQEITNEHQELTKESIALEKERDQLDKLLDSLRDRCEELENQVNDQRLQGVGEGGGGGEGEKEKKSEVKHMLVLKQEFKKMMREQKADGVKLLRAEQEERRRLEGELRKIRQANGPLAKSLDLPARSSGTTTPV